MSVVFVLMAWRWAMVGVQMVVVMMVGVGVVMVVVVIVVVAVVMVVVVVGVMVVARQTVSASTLASHWRAATVSYRCVASLWHVVGVRSATRRQLPGANGRGRSRGRGGA